MHKQVSFGQQLKLERERVGWTQPDLAERLGIDPKTVTRWERNKAFPQLRQRQRICALFSKSAEEMGLAPHSEELEQLLHEDWGGAPLDGRCYGRTEEQAELQRQLVNQQCRLIAVLGIGGIGKTTLTIQVAQQVKNDFDFLFWRSLQNAPPLEQILKQCIQDLSGQLLNLPERTDELLALLLQQLKTRRCLLILDNVESILQAGQRVGEYRSGYEQYGQLIRSLGDSEHQSCLVLTSRERPKELSMLNGKKNSLYVLPLSGLNLAEAQAMLQERQLNATPADWQRLITAYSGNPMALKLVAEFIQEIFDGDIARFLQTQTTAFGDITDLLFGDITDLLKQQFQRLPPLELEILYWLAIEREAVTMETLYNDFARQLSKREMQVALQSLQRRFLVEHRAQEQFTLQPVILEYVTDELVRRARAEFLTQQHPQIWAEYAFLKAQAKDYVRESQQRILLEPITHYLQATMSRHDMEQKIHAMLTTQHQLPQANYVAGNILNMLLFLQYDLHAFDFSHLTIRQGHLQGAIVQDTNFTGAQFLACSFTHTFGTVLSLLFDHQDTVFAAGTSTGEINIYQTENGQLLQTFRGHTDSVWSLAFSSDGQTLVSASDDHSIRFWDRKTGACTRLFSGHSNRVRSIAFNPEETVLASGSEDQTIRLWDLQTGQCFRTLSGHSDRVWSIAFSPDGDLLASGSTDGTVRIWNVADGSCKSILKQHTGWIRAICFAPHGQTLASCSDDHTVRIWDVQTGACLNVLEGHSNRVWTIAFNADGSLLVSGSEDHNICIWESSTGKCLNVLRGHTHGIRTLAIHTPMRILVSGGDDQSIRLWDLSTGACLRTLHGYANRIWSVAFSPDGQSLVSSSEDRSIRVWDLNTGDYRTTIANREHGARGVIFSADGQFLASSGEDQTVRLWQTATGVCLRTLLGHTSWARAIALSGDGSLLASGDEDGLIRVWDVRNPEQAVYNKTLQGHKSWIRALAFHAQGELLASGSDDHSIGIWDVRTGALLRFLQGHSGRVRAVTFLANSTVLASASEDSTVRIWDAATGQMCSVLQGHAARVLAVIGSLDGQTLISSSDDQTIRIWERATGECRHILRGHTQRIRSISLAPDGTTLASASDDGTINLWDIQSATCLRTLINERPYERMNIRQVRGLSATQYNALRGLGAISV